MMEVLQGTTTTQDLLLQSDTDKINNGVCEATHNNVKKRDHCDTKSVNSEKSENSVNSGSCSANHCVSRPSSLVGSAKEGLERTEVAIPNLMSPDVTRSVAKTPIKDVSGSSSSENFSSNSETNTYLDSYSDDTSDDKRDISNAELGLSEDHFSRPEGHFCMSTIEELEMAIENCKEMILETTEKSEKRKKLIRKLIQLRMKLQEVKEGPEPVPPDMKVVLGHHFLKKPIPRPKHYCEKCSGIIWGILQTWHQCKDCGFSCHGKCLNSIFRTCASIKVAENPIYILDVCPEKGLSNQNYRCIECKSHIMFTFPLRSFSCGWTPFSSENSWVEPRLCDYSGQYYCPNCHWNSLSIIPARVLHNWDFETYKVCRGSKQFLRLMKKKAILNIEDINPILFTFVEGLSLVKRLREEILLMKKYFLSCKNALQNKMLMSLSERQHFVESSNMYSMQDLIDINSGSLQEYLTQIHSKFSQHIKEDCEICRGQGYICEICKSEDVLFPFDNIAAVCPSCSWTFHIECFLRKERKCPRCLRKMKRAEIMLNS